MVLATVVGIAGVAGTIIIDQVAIDPELQHTPVGNAVAGSAVLVVGVITIGVIARVVDRRPLPDYGMELGRQWYRECAVGLALGAGLQTGIFSIALAGGWITIDGYAGLSGATMAGIGALLGLYVAVGIVEELFARGWLMKNIGEGLRRFGTAVAASGSVGLSALVFGGLHLGNPGAGLFSTIVIACAGVLFAVGYLWTGQLGFPIGLHIAWNFTQGAIFGFPVSGIPPQVALIETDQVGTEILIGGSFGPEAGLLGLGAIIAGIAGTYWVVGTNWFIAEEIFEPPQTD